MAERRLIPAYGKRVDARCDREVARRAGEEWGVLTTSELAACGLTPKGDHGRGHVRGHLHRLHVGVWAVGHPEPSRSRAGCSRRSRPAGRRRCSAIDRLPASGGSSISRTAIRRSRSSAAARGFVRAIVVHRTSQRGRRGMHPTSRAVPVTTPARTLLDSAAVTARIRACATRCAARRACGASMSGSWLRRRPETGPGRAAAGSSAGIATGPAPTRSVLESVVLDLILSARASRIRT